MPSLKDDYRNEITMNLL